MVLGLSLRFLWRCPARHIRALYNRCLGARHLDIGVGTGYFLAHCRYPVKEPRITLLDLNPTCLQRAATRLADLAPEQRLADALAPLPADLGPFDSVGLSLLLHCLPVPMRDKVALLGRLRCLLAPGGRVFGSTVLGRRSGGRLRGAVLRLYNRKGVFANLDDDVESLTRGLAAVFPRFSVEIRGTVALFVGEVP